MAPALTVTWPLASRSPLTKRGWPLPFCPPPVVRVEWDSLGDHSLAVPVCRAEAAAWAWGLLSAREGRRPGGDPEGTQRGP